MLHILRSKKFARRVMLGILILIIPAFVLWGTGSMSSKPPLVGTIDKNKITRDDLLESMQGFKAELLLSYYTDYNLFSSTLRNEELMKKMAWDRLVMLAAARDAKIKVSNKELLNFLGSHPLFVRDGAFSKQAYSAIVSKTLGMDMKSFEDFTRENMMIRKMQAEIYKNVIVPSEEVKTMFNKLNDKADISYITIKTNTIADVPVSSEEELLAYYNTYKTQFTKAKKVQIEFAEIPFKNKTEKDQMAERISGFSASLRNDPANFQEITEKEGFEYTKTGLLGPNDLITGAEISQDIYSATFNLKVNEISPPFLSGDAEGAIYIFHKINEIEPVALPFEEVKTKIQDILTTRQKINIAEEKAMGLYDDLKSGLTTLEDIASEQNIELISKKGLSAKDYIEGIGPASFIFGSAVPLEKGDHLKPVKYPKGAVIVRIDEIIEPEDGLFEKEKAKITNKILGQKRKEVLEDWFSKSAPKAIKMEGYNKI